jgi:hypothetical protein
MLKVNRGRKRKLGKDVRSHIRGRALNDGDEALLEEVTNVTVLDVVYILRGGHVVHSGGDAALVAFIGDCRSFARVSKSREKLAEDHAFLG